MNNLALSKKHEELHCLMSSWESQLHTGARMARLLCIKASNLDSAAAHKMLFHRGKMLQFVAVGASVPASRKAGHAETGYYRFYETHWYSWGEQTNFWARETAARTFQKCLSLFQPCFACKQSPVDHRGWGVKPERPTENKCYFQEEICMDEQDAWLPKVTSGLWSKFRVELSE